MQLATKQQENVNVYQDILELTVIKKFVQTIVIIMVHAIMEYVFAVLVSLELHVKLLLAQVIVIIEAHVLMESVFAIPDIQELLVKLQLLVLATVITEEHVQMENVLVILDSQVLLVNSKLVQIIAMEMEPAFMELANVTQDFLEQIVLKLYVL